MKSTDSWSTIIPELIHIIESAGDLLLNFYQQDLAITIKEDNSPVTEADQASHQLFLERLGALTPHIPLISEEGVIPPYQERKKWEHVWILDPLDGTKEFIKRNDQFAINLALIEKGAPILGFIYLPVKRRLYWAYRGHGAYLRDRGVEESIRCRPWQGSPVIVSSRSHRDPLTDTLIKKLQDQFENGKIIKMGGAVKFAMVAQGEIHFYPRLVSLSEWDICPGHIIIEEAGGAFLTTPGLEVPRYNSEKLKAPHFLAFSQSILGHINLSELF